MSSSRDSTQRAKSRSFGDDLSDSATLFKLTVKNILEDWFGSTIHSVEATTADETTKLLDQIAGVDAWEFNRDSGTRAIGSRVQWGNNAYPNKPEPWGEVDEPHNTYTVRHERNSGAKTEYEKRLEAIESDSHDLSPHWTVQAYCDELQRNEEGKILNARLLSLGLCETHELITHIRDETVGTNYYQRKVFNNGAATFWVVPFSTLATTQYYENEQYWIHNKNRGREGYFTCDDCGHSYFGQPNHINQPSIQLDLCDSCHARWSGNDS